MTSSLRVMRYLPYSMGSRRVQRVTDSLVVGNLHESDAGILGIVDYRRRLPDGASCRDAFERRFQNVDLFPAKVVFNRHGRFFDRGCQ